MGNRKKESERRERQGKTGDGLANVKTKGENFYRTAKQARTLNMFNGGKAQRNAHGRITKAAAYQSRDKPQARVEPNRKWFENSRVISQDALTAFRDAMAERAADPFKVLIKSNKLPMSLLKTDTGINGIKQHKAKMQVETAPFSDTFGPKSQRKRVTLDVSTLEDLVDHSDKLNDDFFEKRELERELQGLGGGEHVEAEGELTRAVEPIFSKGQSKRIWNELYKVIDSSDVILHILDARDPLGTRCRSVEKYLREEAPHKHMVFVLNKCDLVPTGVAAAWVRALSKDHPTLAFHASINNSFGKGSLIALLRQFSALHSNRKQISVGFIGYPNTGKSSVINTLRKKKVCTVAPIPGETKVWQYITLMKRIYLIDCPGVVPPNHNDTPEDILLRGVVRVENVESPEQYIDTVLKRCKPHHIERTYDIRGYDSSTAFLEALARKGGRLHRGGEADVAGVAKMVLNDFLRGKLPWYTPPPVTEAAAGVEGRRGALGEMGRVDIPKIEGESADADMASDEENEEFEGFEEDAQIPKVHSAEGEPDEEDDEDIVVSDAEESE